ncbi:hypothetical protein BDW42DRAFT_160830 [Aspergillus taichungensis]|uniref:Uncharacterized protein n=1 Tax=Aspergillus taichungensis TaxID=482145 RepID=A0A2J5I5S8_9EURO|nr:hypothetical protein BDW42DRAFT_160830 [Aspergillus taichungensis]
MTFIEDRAIFQNASRDQLRAHFQPWARNAYRAENPRVTGDLDPEVDAPPRYGYFVQVDEDVLSSVVDGEGLVGRRGMRSSYVNFVNGWWMSYGERYARSRDPRWKCIAESEVEEDLEPVDGCVEFNVGWMMLDPIDISVEFYHDVGWGEEFWFGAVSAAAWGLFLVDGL